jgi:hypothetical protein
MRRKYRISGLTSQPMRELTFPVDERGTMNGNLYSPKLYSPNKSAGEVEITVTCENCDLNLIFESNAAEEKSSQTDFILADNQSCSSTDYEDSLSVLNGGDEISVEPQATAPPSTPLFSPWFFWLAFKSWLPRIVLDAIKYFVAQTDHDAKPAINRT